MEVAKGEKEKKTMKKIMTSKTERRQRRTETRIKMSMGERKLSAFTK